MIRNISRKPRGPLRRRPNGAAAFGGRPLGSVFLIINLYGYALYIPSIFHIYSIYIYIYIYFLAMFHIFSLVCFLIYGVKRRQVLIAKPRFKFSRFYTFYIMNIYGYSLYIL